MKQSFMFHLFWRDNNSSPHFWRYNQVRLINFTDVVVVLDVNPKTGYFFPIWFHENLRFSNGTLKLIDMISQWREKKPFEKCTGQQLPRKNALAPHLTFHADWKGPLTLDYFIQYTKWDYKRIIPEYNSNIRNLRFNSS